MNLKRTDIAPIAATDGCDTNRPREAALVGGRAAGVAFIDGGAAGKESLGLGRTAIILQRVEQRVLGRGGRTDLIGRLRGRDCRAGVVADEIKAIRGQCARHIRFTGSGCVQGDQAVPRFDCAREDYNAAAFIRGRIARYSAVGDSYHATIGEYPAAVENAAAYRISRPSAIDQIKRSKIVDAAAVAANLITRNGAVDNVCCPRAVIVNAAAAAAVTPA